VQIDSLEKERKKRWKLGLILKRKKKKAKEIYYPQKVKAHEVPNT